MRLIWLDAALTDLTSAHDWIAHDRPFAALDQLRLVREAVDRLAEFPRLGREGRTRGTRELVVPGTPFIVAYRLREDAVEILRALHGRRRWPG